MSDESGCAASEAPRRAGRASVLAPSPLLTITMEAGGGGGADDAEVHLHAGGQGFWIARLVAELGVDTALCATLGGETGVVLRSLLERERLTLRWVTTAGANGAYLDDRRSGVRSRLGAMRPAVLSRHEVDELYGLALVEGMDAAVTVLGGPGLSPMLPADIYRRLSADLVANGRTVVVDLSGEPLAAAAAGGASVMKMSHEELLAEGRAAGDTVPALAAAMRSLSPEGASAVVCCRAERPALAWFGGRLVEVHAPVFAASDNAGAGDSFTAGLAAALANGCSLDDALRLGAAAGGLNVTRRGLGTGARQEIERLTAHVELVELDPGRLLA